MEFSWKNAPYEDCADTLMLLSLEETRNDLIQHLWIKKHFPWLIETPLWSDFEAKKEQVILGYSPFGHPFRKIMLVGLGKREDLSQDTLYSTWAKAFKEAAEKGSSKIALPFPTFGLITEEVTWFLRELLFTGFSVCYEYTEFKTKISEPRKQIEEQVVLLESEPDGAILDVLSYLKYLQGGMVRARNLINAPSNEVTPERLVKEAKAISEAWDLKITIIDQDEAERMGMGAFVGVAKGSANPGYIIVLEYCPKGCESEKPLLFVGKGITFDTGGISIKPASGMELMKHDMAGAATVLGAMEVVGTLKPARRVVGVMPCAENMPDGKAYRPGDVLKTLSGQTVEVITTDAEGRLILCDAITYAIKTFSPALIVDLATLTGACIIALGDRVAGILGNNDETVEKVRLIGNRVGEKLWPLPLWDFYAEDIKSDVADFKNVGNRKAGTIIGGIFLKQFVPKEIPWVHIDIAGPAWAEKPWFQMPKGATAFGLRTLIELVRTW
ncbi:MAG: leucyl aminopeptidase [Syntrophobacterales bacterium]|nr:leucyl aminopeptidase [Syntrophobacterales bacterium]